MKLSTLLSCCVLFAFTTQAQKTALVESVEAAKDVALDTNADSGFWQGARAIYAQKDKFGKPLPEYRTEIRSRWTQDSIYFLFVCPYQQLYLKPTPDMMHETYQLWDWNVAEVFIGADSKDIQRYKEFEISPQNEWIDLDIDLHKPHHEEGWVWNSGFQHVARIDRDKHVWYAALRIPFTAVSAKAPAPGMAFRINFYRTEGPPQNSREIMWQPVMSNTFHVPERFGLLRLVTK